MGAEPIAIIDAWDTRWPERVDRASGTEAVLDILDPKPGESARVLRGFSVRGDYYKIRDVRDRQGAHALISDPGRLRLTMAMSEVTEEGTEKRDRWGIVACLFLCGAFTGAALAILFAPASGRDTRQRLVARAREGRDRASGVIERGHAVVDRTRAHLQEQTEHAARAVAEGGAALADVNARGKQALEEIKAEAAQAVADAGAAYRDVRNEVTGGRKA